MIYNSIKINLDKKKVLTFDLFAMDAEAMSGYQKRLVSSYCTRFERNKDSFLWEQLESIKDEKNVFFSWMESETTGLMAERKYSVTMDVRDHPRMLMSVLKRDIVNYFRHLGMPVCRDMIGGIEVWEKQPSTSVYYDEYQRYTISPNLSKETGWRLDITQGTRARVSRLSKDMIDDMPATGYDVVAGTMVVHPDRVPSATMVGGQVKLYPVYSHTIAKFLKFKGYYVRTVDKMNMKREAIENFITKYIFNLSFSEAIGVSFPDGGKLMAVPEEEIFRVDDDAHLLLYGRDTSGRDQSGCRPAWDFKKYGPYRAPEQAYNFFFICKNEPNSIIKSRRLINLFRRGRNCEKKWSSLSVEEQGRYPVVCTPLTNLIGKDITLNTSLCMNYNSELTAVQEVRARLEKTVLPTDSHLFAIIVSDIYRDDPDQKRHKIYYELKMELLKKHIQSQVVYREHIGTDSFKYFIPNLAAAMVDKMGGQAWTIKRASTMRDLIVGIGASYRNGRKDPYLGNAVSFDRLGNFIDFDICHAHDVTALSMKLKENIMLFKRKFGSPERIIIHFYKKLNRKESREIEHAMLCCGVDCDVFVVNVVPAANNDVIAFDTKQSDCMPLSGTYVHLRGNSYLLYNNERYFDNEKVRNVVYPIKLSIVKNTHSADNSTTSHDINKEEARDIITQIYQFCRLYHRSVSMQAYPITVAYPERVALFASYLDDDVLPDLAHNSLWML